MNIEDLRHPRINIFYIQERKQDAQRLFSKYANLGAKVTLLEVEDDHSTKQHLGKLYYFDEFPRVKEIAQTLAKDLQGVESVSPHYVQLLSKQQIHYSIWIVKRTKCQTSKLVVNTLKPKQTENRVIEKPKLEVSIETSILPREQTSLTKCPKCKSSVRNDRLERHLAKAHSKEKKFFSKGRNFKPPPQKFEPKVTKRDSEPRIILISKRGTRVQQSLLCDSCHTVELILWRYSESNRGTVHICGRCKSSVFNRSFDKVDAMNLAFQGGAFESNRRRH